jgi:hypothetical protein
MDNQRAKACHNCGLPNSAISQPGITVRLRLYEVDSFALTYRLRTTLSEDCTKIIPGKFGHIYGYDDGALGVLVMPATLRKRYWGCARKTLLKAGFTLVQDGDGEGAAIFDAENPSQARLAIRVAGIKRKRQLPPAQREQRTAYLRTRSGKAYSAVGTRRKPRKVGKPGRRRPNVPRAVGACHE